MWLDTVIETLSPARGLARKRARVQSELLGQLGVRSYDGAKTGRRTDGWVTAGTSANAEIRGAVTNLRDRARDLVRNNPYAAKAVGVYSDALVSYGIKPKPDTESKPLNRQIAAAWKEWCDACDATGHTNFYGLQALAARTVFESGECLVRFRNRLAADGLTVPLQLEVLEPDFLDHTRDGVLAGGNVIVQGIEFDPIGRRAAYWLWNGHPGDSSVWTQALVSRRVPASEVIHLYKKQRPGQDRGVTAFAPALVKMRDLDDYEEAELVRKQIAACLAAFVVAPEGASTVPLGTTATESGTGARVEKLRSGMISYLKPGEDVKFGSPPSDSGYADYVRMQLHALASGLGMTYEQLTSDFSQVNYSSYRAAMIGFCNAIESERWQTFIPGFCDRVWRRFIDTAYLAGAVRKPDYAVKWTPPPLPRTVDPFKDAQADQLMIRSGTKTLPEAIREQGYEPEEHLQEIADSNAKLDQLKIALDSDPRSTGAAKGAPANTKEVPHDETQP